MLPQQSWAVLAAPREQGHRPPEAPRRSGNSGVIGTGWLLSKMEISPLARGSDVGLHPCSLSLSLATFQGSLCSQRASDKLLGRGALFCCGISMAQDRGFFSINLLYPLEDAAQTQTLGLGQQVKTLSVGSIGITTGVGFL